MKSYCFKDEDYNDIHNELKLVCFMTKYNYISIIVPLITWKFQFVFRFLDVEQHFLVDLQFGSKSSLVKVV